MAKVKTYNYHNVRKFLTKKLEKYQERSDKPLPKLSTELQGNTTSINFGVSADADFYNLVGLVTTLDDIHIKNYGHGSLHCKHSTGKFSNTDLTVWLRKRAMSSFSFSDIEISKKGGFTEEEASLVLKLYRAGNPICKKITPESELLALGVAVYDSKTEEKLVWDNLAGYEKAKQEIKDTIILPLKHPEVYDNIVKNTRQFTDNNRPRAVLFEGPPGTGKTTCARIIASEENSKLVYVPIESIMTKWYGESSRNLSAIFDACQNLGDVIIFLDEIDSLATSRDGNIHEATRRVLSVLLRKLDGFVPEEKVITIGATNRMCDLDPALIRRFDATVTFPLPNLEERAAIYSVYAKQLSGDAVNELSNNSEKLSGSDIKNICVKTERRWASQVINKKTQGNSPRLEDYLQTLKNTNN